jgi:hypothetical protein
MLLLGACSTDSVLEERANLITGDKQEKIEETVDVTPDWFVDLPKEPEAVYSVGTAISGDMQFSMDKAILNAKVALADRINGKLSASQKSFMAETRRPSGAGSLGTLVENEKVAKNIIAEIAVNGYNIHKSKIVEEGTYYRTFVLLEFPIGDANDIMMSMIKRSNEVEARVRAKRAHKQLEIDVDKVKDHEIEKQKVIIEELNR